MNGKDTSCLKPRLFRLKRGSLAPAILKLTILATSLLLIPVTASYAKTSQDLCQVSDQALAEASAIRGLKVLKKVPCKLQNKETVANYLRTVITKRIPAEKLKAEEILYKLVGIIPEEFDYVHGIISLYTDQLGGYYDAEADYYAMADWMPPMMQLPIAVHEQTHALQDQHFQMEKLMDPVSVPTDEQLARSALAEGDATAVMFDFTNKLSGNPPLKSLDSTTGLMMQNLAGAMMSPSLGKAPAVLQAIMLFPYVSGLNFAHQMLQRGGYSEIDGVFRSPPRSTSQILHPSQYLKERRDAFKELDLPSRYQTWSVRYSDRLGEFVIGSILGQWVARTEATAIATHWKNDRLFLFAEGNDAPLSLWVTTWEDASSAEKFARALMLGYSKRFGVSAGLSGATTRIETSGSKLTQSVELRLAGSSVEVIMLGR